MARLAARIEAALAAAEERTQAAEARALAAVHVLDFSRLTETELQEVERFAERLVDGEQFEGPDGERFDVLYLKMIGREGVRQCSD